MVSLTRNERIDWYCMLVPSLCSLAAGSWVLLTFWRFPKLRTPTMMLVLMETCSEMLFNLGHNVAFYHPASTGTPACNFNAWFMVTFALCTLFFATTISAYIVSTIRRTVKYKLTPQNLAILAASLVCLAGGIAALPFATNQYVNFGPVCWIAEGEEGRSKLWGTIFRFPGHYCIIWACTLYIMYSYYSILKFLRQNAAERASFSDDNTVRKTVRLLMWYPIICFVVWSPLTGMRIYSSIEGGDAFIPIWAIGGGHVILSFQGAMFAFVFSQYRSVRTEWSRLFARAVTRGGMAAMFGVTTQDAPTENPIVMGSTLESDSAGSSGRSTGSFKKIMLPVESTVYYTETAMSTTVDVELSGVRPFGIGGAAFGQTIPEECEDSLELRTTDEELNHDV